MKVVELYGRVRYAVQIEGLSRREAARQFGIDPRTVAKMLAFSVPPGYRRRRPPARPKLDPFTEIIDGILMQDEGRPRKQRHTSKRIFERLRDEHGYAGGVTIVKDYVLARRLRQLEVFVPLRHDPGHAQADFGEAVAEIAGVERKIHFFAVDLPHSDACFVLLAIEDLQSAYGLSRVLFGISLDIAVGECVCLLGRNGVGKTTTMRSVMGLLRPTSGRVVWKGTDIAGWAPHRVARAGIGFVPEDRRVFAQLTVWENLDVAARAAGRSGYWTLDAVYGLFPKLRELRNRPGGYLSGGEQQMLTVARTLMGNPELLLLDEPSEGLAPLVVESLLDNVRALKAGGVTILLAEQGVDFSLALADRVYILEKGSIRHTGPAAELRDDTALRDRLLAL